MNDYTTLGGLERDLHHAELERELHPSETEKFWKTQELLGEEIDVDNMTPEQEAEYDQAHTYYELGRLLQSASDTLLYHVLGDINPETKGRLWRVLEDIRAD